MTVLDEKEILDNLSKISKWVYNNGYLEREIEFSKYKDSIEILTFSEVLSTEESKTIYTDMRKSNYKISQKVNLDDLSASIILQSWFNENMVN